ncbi:MULTISPECIES: alpha-pore-forming tripartite toxin MakABE regulator [Flavobacteriaceae]|uniref:Inclusion body protein n=2 Tax=Flavobacteriaceae TaxID=49546 RepID=A0A4Y8AWV7_9FLAO|nr:MULTISPECIES: hypothetical protein [Flavobacteriaceae]TEW76959.1 hypothetical protein E2488_03675 [Gramella jeungdoensis]GGK59009.1 hypothetical protein GCM10007963_28950 [Lutibacter litoralis]
MKQIDILMVVDTQGALASNDLTSNIYLIDTNKYVGSGNEGQAELKTACKDGQIINWRVSAINPGNDVEIVSFSGQMITGNFSNPVKQGLSGEEYWEGRIEVQGKAQTIQYNATLSIDGKAMTFDPYLIVSI